MTARLITVNDVYASDPHIVIDIDDFEDVIGSISGSRRDRLKEIPVHIVHGRYDRVVSPIPGGSPSAGFTRRWQQRGKLLYYHGRA